MYRGHLTNRDRSTFGCCGKQTSIKNKIDEYEQNTNEDDNITARNGRQSHADAETATTPSKLLDNRTMQATPQRVTHTKG